MKVLKTIKAIALVAVFMTATAALAEFEYKGYMRVGRTWTGAGYGYNGTFGMINQNAKYYGRLGRETGGDNGSLYMENTLINSWMLEGSSVWGKTVVTQTLENGNVGGDVGDAISPTNVGGSGENQIASRLREAYVTMGGLGFSPDTSFWIGKRFLNRQDVHIIDWYYLDFSGIGFGAVNIAGIGLDAAVMSWDKGGEIAKKGRDVANTFVLKYENKMVRVDASYSMRNERSSAAGQEATNGYFLMAQFKPEKFFYFMDGASTIGAGVAGGSSAENLWWGSRIPKTEDQGKTLNKKALSYQAVITGLAQVTPSFCVSEVIGVVGINVSKDRKSISDVAPFTNPEAATSLQRIFAVVRPQYNVHKNVAIALEAGYYMLLSDKKSVTGDDDGNATNGGYYGNFASYSGLANGAKKAGAYKITPALILTMDEGFWSRPQLRFFVSYEGLVDKKQKATSGQWAGKSSLVCYGAQAEAWW